MSVSSSEHPLVARLVALSTSHALRPAKEDDLRRARLDAGDEAQAAAEAAERVADAAEAAAAAAPAGPQPPTASAPAPEQRSPPSFDMSAIKHGRPLPLHIASDPAWLVDGSAVHAHVRVLDMLSGGRNAVASPCRSLNKIKCAFNDQHNRDLLDIERDTLSEHAKNKYTLQRWLDEVPWRFRSTESTLGTKPTASKKATPAFPSYEAMQKQVVRGTAETPLSPSYLFILSDKYNVGVFLVVDNSTQGDTGDVEYYHIRSPGATGTDSIVLLLTAGHYEPCQWLDDDGTRRVRTCRQGSRMYRAMEALFAQHTERTAAKSGVLLTEEHERRQLEKSCDDGGQATASIAQAESTSPQRRVLPPRNAPVDCTEREELVGDEPASPLPQSMTNASAVQQHASPQKQTSLLYKQTGRHHKQRSRHRSRSKERDASPPKKGKMDGARAARMARERRAASAVYVGGAASANRNPLTPRQVAGHGQLYDFISFTNGPQWKALNVHAWNRYRVSSQGNDRAAQAQTVEDLLMLPQRILTRTSRGAGDGRSLTSIVNGRCRDVGLELRLQWGCLFVRDNNVQLDCVTPQLSQPVRTLQQANPSTAETEDELDSEVETVRIRPA